MPKKGSEHNSRRLFISMLIIILSLLCIAIPLIISSYKEFIKAQDALIEIKSVGAVADLANKISRERGPANNAMTSAPQDLSKNIQALTQHRLLVDQQMNITFNHLKQAGFLSIADQLKNIANTDKLTGVSNRLALDEYLKLKQKIPHFFENMRLIMIDIDNFKRINDQYGHILGDSVIVAITESLKENVIHSDLIVRFGGDEFLIILSGFESEQVHIYAEKIRESVFHLNLIAPESMEQLMVSVSIGVSFGAESWIALLEKADRSLLKAKEKGKNAVES